MIMSHRDRDFVKAFKDAGDRLVVAAYTAQWHLSTSFRGRFFLLLAELHHAASSIFVALLVLTISFYCFSTLQVDELAGQDIPRLQEKVAILNDLCNLLGIIGNSGLST
uniref:Uncharacterized protein n=1 Tax=Monopterus albus TaxID=43700 RepID=A0A3Q3IJ52_MONAL